MKKRQSFSLVVTTAVILFALLGPLTPFLAKAATNDADGKFTVAIIPDTQLELISSRIGREVFDQRNRWLAYSDKVDDLRYVIQTGDMVTWNTPDPTQIEGSSKGMRVLEQANIPWSSAIGNHDTGAVGPEGGGTGLSVRHTVTHNSYFPPSRFPGMVTFEPGKVDNNYRTFEACGMKWLVLILEFNARTAAIDWAKNVVASHSDYNVMVATHSYLTSSGGISQNKEYGDNSAQYLFDNLIKVYSNIKFVFSGHVGQSLSRTDYGIHGNKIVSYLGCMHDFNGNPVKLMEIDVKNGTVTTQMHQPWHNTTWGSQETISGMSFVGTPTSQPAGTKKITTSTGVGGNITPAGPIYVPTGSNQTFTVTPKWGYVLSSVTVNGNPVSLTGNKYTLSNVQADASISATFSPINTHTVDTSVSAGDVSALHSSNLLNGLLPAFNSEPPKQRPISSLTNGNGTDHVDFYVDDVGAFRMVYDLGETAVIDSLLFAGINNLQYATGKYELYVSDSIYNWDVGAPVVVYNNTSSPTLIQKFNFNAGTKPVGRYVGIVIRDISVSSGDGSARIAELGAYGSVAPNAYNVETDITSADISALHDSNLIKGKLPSFISRAADSSRKEEYMTNGVGLTTNAHVDFWVSDTSNFRMVYDLGQTEVIGSLLFAGYDQIQNATGKYEFYVFNTFNDASSWQNDPVAVYDNTANTTLAQKITFAPNQKPSGRYVGLKITDVSVAGSDLCARIAEVGVYGSYTVRTDITSADISSLHNSNLIKGKLPSFISRASDSSRKEEYMTNGIGLDANAHVDFWVNDTDNFRMVYDLGQMASVESLLFTGYNLIQHATGKYEFYVFNTFNDASSWQSEPVAVYDNTANTTLAQKITFAPNQKPVGRYIGLKITDVDVDQNNQCARIAEIGVYGSYS